MVVRLKDLRNGQTSNKKEEVKTGGVVRLKDIRKQEGEKQAASFKQSEQKFGHVSANPVDSEVMQIAAKYNTDHPTEPTWNGVIDNPIGRGAGKVLGAVGTGIEKAKEITGLDRVQGAVRGLSTAEYPTHTSDGTYLGEYKSLAQNAVEGVSNIAKSTVQGFLHPKEADKKFGEVVDQGLQNTNPVTRFAGKMVAEGATDPTSYIPIPIHTIVKGFKNLPSTVSTALDRYASRNSPIKDFAPEVQPTLALPPASAESMAAYAKRNGNVLPTNENPILGQGDVQTLALPESNTPRIISDIKKQAADIMKPPKARKDLIDYVGQHLEIPREEVVKLSDADLYEVGQGIRKTANMEELHAKLAADQGHNWNDLVSGKSVTGNVEAPLNRIQDVRPPAKPNLIGAKQGVDAVAAPTAESKVVRLSDMRKEVAATTTLKPKVEPIKGTVIKNETVQPRTTTILPDTKIKGQQLKDLRTGDETGFANTVKNSEQTAPSLKQAITNEPITGARTSDVLNRQEANKIINKHGLEGTHDVLMAKTKQFSAAENTAAQIVAKHLSSLGGEDNLKKAINLVSKTAKGGREMGQAIQALTQWNKLDETGALMIGEKQLNKGIKNTEDWKSLTVEQGKPITEAAQRIGQAQDTKNLADEVLHIVTNKADGVALTEAEKATIKQFQDQVKLINEKGKGILSKPKAEKVVNKSDETIKEVSQIEPKTRTRDQVVSFLDAKADKARQRLAASKQMGFAAVNKGNPVIDYAIIGASHIAKGVVKLSDFTEAMVRDFGEGVRPYINESFKRATNIFRKENGLPTVEQLDKAVNDLVKGDVAASRKAYNDVIEKYKKMGDTHGLTEKQIKDLADEAAKNATTRFTVEQANQFKAWASEIGHYADKNLKIEATQDLQRALNDIGTSTLGDKLSATQTAAQLLNPTTLARNVIGNEAFNLVQKTNKLAAAPIDWVLSKITGERTVVFHAKNQEKYWNNWVKGGTGGWKGISPNGQFEAFDIHPNAFKSDKNPLKYLQKALGAELQSFDHAAYMRAYGRTVAEYAKITGKKIEDLDQAIFDLADEAGRYATFQDDTFLSNLATGTKRLLNKPTDLLADALVHKGVLPESLSWKGFGTGDLILKYAKTPANIVMRGIEYSPIGFMRGLGELIPLITGKAFNQRAATVALSRGITGSLGMTSVGYALISSGILTGKSSDDADIRSLDLQSGKGEYKVNWDALSRYVKGGLDKKAAVWQKGDNITDWGWLQPMAISISMGVNAQQSVEKQKTEGVNSYVGVAKDALLGSLKTIMQQPLLSGVQNLVSGVSNVMRYGSWTGIANIFKGLPASFVPSALNQTRNFTDNTTRNTYDPSALKEALNMVINKIPGLDKKLPIAYDTLGGKREQIQGGQDKTKIQGVKTFLSPVKLTQYQVSPEAKMIMDLINETGNETVAPRTPKKYLMVNKKKIELTPKQYSEIQQKTGEATQQALAKISAYLSSDAHSDDEKVKKVVDTLNKVGDDVRTQLNKEYPELKPLTANELKRQVK